MHQTSIVTHLKLDVDADGSLYKPSAPLNIKSSSLNKTDIHLTSTNKSMTKTTTIKKRSF